MGRAFPSPPPISTSCGSWPATRARSWGGRRCFAACGGATTTARIAAWTWLSPVCAAGSGMTATTRPASRRCARRVIYSYPRLGNELVSHTPAHQKPGNKPRRMTLMHSAFSPCGRRVGDEGALADGTAGAVKDARAWPSTGFRPTFGLGRVTFLCVAKEKSPKERPPPPIRPLRGFPRVRCLVGRNVADGTSLCRLRLRHHP